MPEAVTLKIGGVCTEITEKPTGWTTFAIDVGSQHPVRLDTKLPAVIAQGREVGSQFATWTYKESQGNPNPNRPGSFYMDRRLESVELGGEATGLPAGGNSAPASTVPHTYDAPHPGDKDRAIVRQTAIKASAQLLAGALNAGEPLDDVMKRFFTIAAQIEIWVYRDLGGDDNLPFV